MGKWCSLGDVELLLLEVGRDALHDLLSLDSVVNLEGEEVARRAQLELGDGALLVLLDGDLLGLGELLPLAAHDLDEFLQVLDFLGLTQRVSESNASLTIFCEPI